MNSLLLTVAITSAALSQSYSGVQTQTDGGLNAALPRLLILDANPTPAETAFINETNPSELVKECAKLKLKTKRFSRFTLYYSRKILCLEDAERQTVLLRECSKILKDGSPILHVSDLSADSQSTIRGMLLGLNSAPDTKTAAMLPDLTLFGGLEASATLHLGNQTASFFTPPNVKFEEFAQAANTLPTDNGLTADLGHYAAEKLVAEPVHRAAPLLEFVFSHAVETFDRLAYMDEARQYLEDETKAAKEAFAAAEKQVRASVNGRYSKSLDGLENLGRTPGFSDLSPDDQSKVGSFFRAVHGSGSIDPSVFLAQATTDSFQINFTLTLYISAGNGGYETSTIFFKSPFTNANP